VGWLPAGIVGIAFVLVVGRSTFRWAAREGRRTLLVEPGGRIVFDGETLFRPGEGVSVRVERVEGWDDGPVIHFQVVVKTTNGRVLLPVPDYGQWSTYERHWHDWTFGFDSREEADRFAAAVAGASGLALAASARAD